MCLAQGEGLIWRWKSLEPKCSDALRMFHLCSGLPQMKTRGRDGESPRSALREEPLAGTHLPSASESASGFG